MMTASSIDQSSAHSDFDAPALCERSHSKSKACGAVGKASSSGGQDTAPGLTSAQLDGLVKRYSSGTKTSQQKKDMEKAVLREFAGERINESERDQLLDAIQG
ncbi:hypothetical protein FRB94_001596 [Tulasnella sp. JGI-2019a]|nr:hypothetical protein FRB93_003306 [Tulasnella sp. JGI-2019a]KAG9005372.1 hypothetical protein FRB94_001596 [Tulasnella sp. JGI-2019a]KAG9032804.1 hypothetical protein FRB95_000970 [Tulasnella sp. JGI-2019a]